MARAKGRDAYLFYLMSLVLPETSPALPEGGGRADSTALFLFHALDEVEFTAVHRMDDNRIADAMDIRRGYGGPVYGPVTLLEILVELSLYLAYAREKLIPESDPWRWFSEMIHNAGIQEDMSYNEIIRIGERIVANERSLFPITEDGEYGSNMELWMQLNRYLVERYHA